MVELAAQLQAGIEEIRRLAHGIYPPLLASGGLAQAIPAAAAKASVTTKATINRIGRYSPEIETAVYFCCLEALQTPPNTPVVPRHPQSAPSTTAPT